eukprot:TRINITY_DN24030_c0_g1_i1.p1 TRINITY_DN24030_c0_g1~~TRINITY_DN24030_c0_g1_i1.p1  ORF type:complete len:300 (-),score=57.62 TRINITY_DN24030_c0_g1_i1:426-1283(-)
MNCRGALDVPLILTGDCPAEVAGSSCSTGKATAGHPYRHQCASGSGCLRTAVYDHAREWIHVPRAAAAVGFQPPEEWSPLGAAVVRPPAPLVPGSMAYEEVELVGSPAAKDSDQLDHVVELLGSGTGPIHGQVISCIRVQNPTVWEAYRNRRGRMMAPNEQYLFHGCKTAAVADTIKREGLAGSRQSTYTPYGTWLSDAAQYSFSAPYAECLPNGNRRAFVCLALVGQPGTTAKKHKHRGVLADGQAADCIHPVNDRGGDGDHMFVFQDGSQMYPLFYVTVGPEP